MTERNPSKLQFSIEESVWLNKGQEVDELYNIALDPNVTIEETEDQVCIKGYLCLTGEYSYKNEDQPEESNSVNPLSYRSFSQLEDMQEETVKLDHRFPVDITLPKSRVQNADELYVAVEQFDYDLPTPSCIEVSASICVSGVYENQDDETNEDTYASEEVMVEEESQYDFSEENANPFPILEFESRRAPQSYNQSEMVEETEYQAPRREPQVGFSGRTEDQRASEEYSVNYMRGPEYQQTPQQPYRDEMYSSEDQNYEEEEYEEEYSYEEDDYEYEYEEDNDSSEPDNSNRPQREENALYLTSMVTRDEEVLTKMKMCITQAGDSLDTIAGKYDVPASHLMRVNRLESEEIEEGQILYIPVSAPR